MTSYDFIHVFPGLTVAELIGALTDPAHQAAQDRAGDIERREIIERVKDDNGYRCESRVFPRRQLPGFVKPLVRGGLELHEVVTWTRGSDTVEIDVQPAIFGGRSRIRTSCVFTAQGPDVRRNYRGTVTVEVALIGGKVERTIVAEIERSLERGRATTLAFLGRAP